MCYNYDVYLYIPFTSCDALHALIVVSSIVTMLCLFSPVYIQPPIPHASTSGSNTNTARAVLLSVGRYRFSVTQSGQAAGGIAPVPCGIGRQAGRQCT